MAEQVIETTIQVRRASTAQWEAHKDYVPAAGEPCLNLDTGILKFGDGSTTYENLKECGASATCYEGIKTGSESDTDVITRVLTAAGVEAKKDDIFIVKTLIAGEKYQSTAYNYNGSSWVALDGNYNAKNVIFDNDLLFTQQFGKYKPDSSGSVTLPASAKSLYDILMSAYSEEKNPTTTQPSVSVKLTEAKAYEVGTQVTPNYSATFNEGNYSYKPDSTGVTVTAWEITDTAGHTATTASGSFDAITVADNTNYSITAKATYGDGAIPKTNLGNDYAAGQIKAGSKSATSGKITGYRNSFYGTLTSKPELTSAIIRSNDMTKSGKALANGSKFAVTIPVGALRVVIAYPATLRDVTSISDVNGLGAEIKSSFAQSTISVEGANGATGIDYKVYVLDFANANDTANTYNVTI